MKAEEDQPLQFVMKRIKRDLDIKKLKQSFDGFNLHPIAPCLRDCTYSIQLHIYFNLGYRTDLSMIMHYFRV